MIHEKALPTETQTEQTTFSEPPPRMTEAHLTRIWLIGAAAWGNRWTSSLGDLPIDEHGKLTLAGRLWADQLAGLSQSEILKAMRDFSGLLEWPPSLAALRKRAIGIPSFTETTRDLRNQNNGFTRLVASHLDMWAFGRADQDTANRMLKTAYDFATELALMGVEYPVRREQDQVTFTVTERNPASPEAIAKAKEEINRLFGRQGLESDE